MALNKLFQQFTGAGRDSKKSEESASAQQIDQEVTTSDPLADMFALENPVVMTPHGPISNAPQAAAVAETVNQEPKPALVPLNPIEKGILEEEIIETMRTCYDPEIPVNIYDMGLIYEIDIDKSRFVNVKMTLTSPGCPVAGILPPEVERKVANVEGVSGAKVTLVWEPTWTMEFMSEEARLDLGLY